jgi:hypothetical protein
MMELVYGVFSGRVPNGGTEAAFLFSETADNQSSVLRAAAELIAGARTRSLRLMAP